jgi:hypothetical protein
MKRSAAGTTGLVLTERAWSSRRAVMADILYLGVTVVFFWLSWLLVGLCERL